LLKEYSLTELVIMRKLRKFFVLLLSLSQKWPILLLLTSTLDGRKKIILRLRIKSCDTVKNKDLIAFSKEMSHLEDLISFELHLKKYLQFFVSSNFNKNNSCRELTGGALIGLMKNISELKLLETLKLDLKG